MLIFLQNNLPFVWLALAVIFAVIEGVTMGLATIWFALAALVTMVLAFLKIPFSWQILIFLVISGVLFLFTRPVVKKKLKVGNVKTNSEELIGKIGLVTENIPRDDKGLVKVSGQIWSAVSQDGGEIAAGAHVQIVELRGVTLYVIPENKSPGTSGKEE